MMKRIILAGLVLVTLLAMVGTLQTYAAAPVNYVQDGRVRIAPSATPDSVLLTIPHIDEIQINVYTPVIPYDKPNGEAVKLADGHTFTLPHDYDGNGFDTYIVTDAVEIDGEVWYSIFLGSETFVWVTLP